MGRAALSGLDEADALIRHWLHEKPAQDFDDFLRQTKQARCLEARYFDAMATVFGSKKR